MFSKAKAGTQLLAVPSSANPWDMMEMMSRMKQMEREKDELQLKLRDLITEVKSLRESVHRLEALNQMD